jgi:7-alpha-hydroxysteroid dehydrogenase
MEPPITGLVEECVVALEQFDLTGRVAIVTGAGKGVGQGIARVLAEAGATVVGTARTESDIVATIQDIEQAGGKGLAVVADAMNRADGERVVATAIEHLGRIDILVNNVGGSTYARFLDITDDDFRHTFDWCVTSAFIMSQLATPHMLEAGHGSIINISSGSARFGIRALAAYCVAKGGLEALTRAMAQELAPKIRVNAIALGSFATDGLQGSLDLLPGSLEKMKEATPLHRLGDVDDLGRLCVYLSTAGCYATNAIFHVDGGIDANNSPLPIPDY